MKKSVCRNYSGNLRKMSRCSYIHLLQCVGLLQFLFLTVNLREVRSNVYTKLGSSAEMKCPKHTTSSETAWFRSDHISQISIGNELNEKIDQNRFKIIGNSSTKIYNLKILNVIQSDLGEYSCSITDGNVSQLFTLNLIQLRPPIGMQIYYFNQNEVTFHSNIAGSDKITANENETIHLVCNITSGIPEENLMWFYKGKILTFGGPGSLTLKLTLLPKDSGRYICKANSSALEEAMIKTVNIDVLYKPRVSLSVNSTLHIVEGSSLTVYCNVKSNPEILNVTWWRTFEYDNKTISSRKILHVNLATRRDSAKYVCVAENIKGRGMAHTEIMVMYAPDINIQYENYTQVSKERHLKCLPKGFPDLYTFYSWEHTSDYGDHIRFLSGTADGSLLLPEIADSSKQYQDNGFYKCTATNGIADSKGQTNRSASVYLSITGIPVFVAENTNVFYGVENEPADIAVTIFSNPKYSDFIIKNKDGNRLLNNGIDMKMREQHMFVTDVIHASRVRVKSYRITFVITKLRPDMAQNYTVFVQNDYGNNQFQISVLFASYPDTPLDVTVLSFSKCARIDWTANFNGGLKQNFFIEYLNEDSSVWQTVKTLNTTSNGRISWTIHHLQAGYLYGFRMFARNRIGDSNKTNEIFVAIKNENVGFSLYIVLTGSASVILAFTIVFTAYCIRRCLRRKIQINHSSTQTYKIEAGQYEEIDEDQMIHVHDIETAASHDIHITYIDSDYEQPENSVIRQRSNSEQINLPSASSSEGSENDINENDTFAKDLILISYKQLTGDRSPPLPYDTLDN